MSKKHIALPAVCYNFTLVREKVVRAVRICETRPLWYDREMYSDKWVAIQSWPSLLQVMKFCLILNKSLSGRMLSCRYQDCKAHISAYFCVAMLWILITLKKNPNISSNDISVSVVSLFSPTDTSLCACLCFGNWWYVISATRASWYNVFPMQLSHCRVHHSVVSAAVFLARNSPGTCPGVHVTSQ